MINSKIKQLKDKHYLLVFTLLQKVRVIKALSEFPLDVEQYDK